MLFIYLLINVHFLVCWGQGIGSIKKNPTKITTLCIYIVYKENILNGVFRHLKTCILLGRIHILAYYSFLNVILYLGSQISKESVDRIQGDPDLGWRKKCIFILTNNDYLAFSSNNECRQQITVLLAPPVTLSLINQFHIASQLL